MALYEVTEAGTDKPRLIEAKSDTAALAFVTTPRFTVSRIVNPMRVVELMGDGVQPEKAVDAVVTTESVVIGGFIAGAAPIAN